MITAFEYVVTPSRNIVLIGDAVHSTVNCMAQGAATAIQAGIVLVNNNGEAVKGDLTLAEAAEHEQEPHAETIR